MNEAKRLAEVLVEEARRQKRSLRSVGEAAGNKHALHKLANGGTVEVQTAFNLARALGLPLHELVYRVERGPHQSGTSGSTLVDSVDATAPAP